MTPKAKRFSNCFTQKASKPAGQERAFTTGAKGLRRRGSCIAPSQPHPCALSLFPAEPFRIRQAEDLSTWITSSSKKGLPPGRGAAAARRAGEARGRRTMVAVAAPPTATATAARAALRRGHVARGARSRDGSRGALGPPPMLTPPGEAAARFSEHSQDRVTELTPGLRRCPCEGTVPQTARHPLRRT